MNIFQEINHQQTYLQLYPQPHWFQQWNTTTPAQMAPTPSRPLHSTFNTPDFHHTILASETQLGRGSNTTVAEQPFLPSTNDRGSACCVTVDLPWLNNSETGTTVLVGLTHTKLASGQNPYWTHDRRHRYMRNVTWGWNRYLSRLLAYQPVPPFAVVAQSGWLCLSFGTETESGGPMWGAALDLFGTTYKDCPAIHFVSSIAESASNRSHAIIGYGVNDCYARLIVVHKAEIAARLTPAIT